MKGHYAQQVAAAGDWLCRKAEKTCIEKSGAVLWVNILGVIDISIYMLFPHKMFAQQKNFWGKIIFNIWRNLKIAMPAFLIFPKYVLHCCKAEDRRNFHRKVIKALNESWKIDANTKVSNNLMQWRENANILRNDAIACKYQYRVSWCNCVRMYDQYF